MQKPSLKGTKRGLSRHPVYYLTRRPAVACLSLQTYAASSKVSNSPVRVSGLIFNHPLNRESL